MIGLMMIKDEADMLEEALGNHLAFCEKVFVLDGTTGPLQPISEEICRSFHQVAGYWRDEETSIPRPLRDGARGFLLQKARQVHGLGHWYAVLHGDEIWCTDPREFVKELPDNTQACSINLYHFFPHVSERNTWNFLPFETSIEECATNYMIPGVIENRLFFDCGQFSYEIPRHSLVIPRGMHVTRSQLAVKQYNYRSPSQAHLRAVGRLNDSWQQNHYQHLLDGTDNFFIKTLFSETRKWAAVRPGEGGVTNTSIRPLPILMNEG